MPVDLFQSKRDSHSTFHIKGVLKIWKCVKKKVLLWHVSDRGEAELRHSLTGVQLKSHPGQCHEWGTCAVNSLEKLQLASRGTEWALWQSSTKKRTRRKSLGVKNTTARSQVLKAAFMYSTSNVFWDDPAIKDITNCCLLSWKCYLLSEVTKKNLNSLQGNKKMSRITDTRQDRY